MLALALAFFTKGGNCALLIDHLLKHGLFPLFYHTPDKASKLMTSFYDVIFASIQLNHVFC